MQTGSSSLLFCAAFLQFPRCVCSHLTPKIAFSLWFGKFHTRSNTEWHEVYWRQHHGKLLPPQTFSIPSSHYERMNTWSWVSCLHVCVWECCVYTQACVTECACLHFRPNVHILWDEIWVKWRVKSLHRVNVCLFHWMFHRERVSPRLHYSRPVLTHACAQTCTQWTHTGPLYMSSQKLIIKYFCTCNNKYTHTQTVLGTTICSMHSKYVDKVIK